MAKKVTLYEWPVSQYCLECVHSNPVEGEKSYSACICMLNIILDEDHMECEHKIEKKHD